MVTTMNPSTILSVPANTTQLLANAEAARLHFQDVTENASMAAGVLYKNLVKTGMAKGMSYIQARRAARRVTRQLHHVASLANAQAAAMRVYAITYTNEFLNAQTPASKLFDMDK
jgi:hypothetical protein